MSWKPRLGAWPVVDGASFAVWAPDARRLEVLCETPGKPASVYPLEKDSEGVFTGTHSGIGAGDLYRYRLDGAGPYPDPASRFQPQGLHGPSQVIDPNRFPWTDRDWKNVEPDRLVLYELHVGTFTPGGTFNAAIERLPYLKDLGVTAVELMPVAAFPGNRNWGYDGAALFAPARSYGAPDDLRTFVNEAHRTGLAVHLDVVYNHFGPDGAYAPVFSKYYFSERHRSPWGAGINLDGEHSAQVRRFFIENALHWIHEYHIDGLRLDATHALVDDSPRYFLAELAAAVRASGESTGRKALLVAEDTRNLNYMLQPESEGGWGLDGVWSDDFHHQVRRCLAGDADGYFSDFDGTVESIAATVRQGWFFTGQYAPYFGHQRGTGPASISPAQCVFFIQNHDQVGNRAFGDRLHHAIDLASYRAATVLLLLAPEAPLLFMGQEWAAGTPFQFFTDHEPGLGRKVTEGRRREFAKFRAFADPALRERIPDPQAPATFEASRLVWEETTLEPHLSTLALHRRLLALRAAEPVFRSAGRASFAIRPSGDSALVLRRGMGAGPAFLAVIRLKGAGGCDLGDLPEANPGPGRRWQSILTTEDAAFTPDPVPLKIPAGGLAVEFSRPGAVILTAAGEDG
jgi:maltooligosyltrehalose trehalohydrolase